MSKKSLKLQLPVSLTELHHLNDFETSLGARRNILVSGKPIVSHQFDRAGQIFSVILRLVLTDYVCVVWSVYCQTCC